MNKHLLALDSFDYFFICSNNSFFLLLPEFFLILAIFLYLCIIKNFKSFYISSLFFYFILFVELFFFAYFSVYVFCQASYVQSFFFNSCFYADFYSIFCKLFIVFFLILISIFVESKFIWKESVHIDIFIPILFFLFFSLVLLSAFDLFTAYLALEGVSLSLYTLAAITYHKRIAIEAAVKYFVFGGISNGLLLFGNSLLFGLSGSLNFLEIKYLFHTLNVNLSSIEISLSLVCFVVVFLFKVAAFPCHMWSPDVYEGV